MTPANGKNRIGSPRQLASNFPRGTPRTLDGMSEILRLETLNYAIRTNN